ncbi:MAG TPA: M4 family metallopeptidase [Kofleriaceae bacterium]|nr:M4 family metallopeptidase [Kofleriaceae bacterium]
MPFARLAAAVAAALAAAACGASSDPPAPIATEPVRHMETAMTPAGADLAASAAAYVEGHLGGSFEPVAQTTAAGLRHVRLQQVHGGVPVHNSIVVAHADRATFLGFNGFATRNLDGFDLEPAVSADRALAAAREGHGATSAEATTLVILPGRGGAGARLAWRASFRDQAGRWRAFVDARDGTVLRTLHDVHTAVVQASGAGRVRGWDAELDVEEEDGELEMETDRLKTVDASDDDEVVKGDDVAAMPDIAANDAHGYAEITLRMMREWMGRDSIDDEGYTIESRVHEDDTCGNGPDNACWDGETVSYGTGGDGTHDWSAALDIVGHEINHGFTEFHSGLEYEEESGGLNESFSDVAGAIAEFYDEGDEADFEIGEDLYSGAGWALRYMCEPTTDGYSIDSASDYREGAEVHSSSGIGNRAFCLAVGRYRAGSDHSITYAVERIGHVWYVANAAYWTSGTGFDDACRGTVDAARALGLASDQVEAIGQSWADVGVTCSTSDTVCDGDGECDGTDGETCAGCPDDCGTCAEACTEWHQHQCQLGLGDCSACDDESELPRCGDHVCGGDETDATCGQDCGCAALECEDLAPFGCYCDDSCADFGDCCADLGDAC